MVAPFIAYDGHNSEVLVEIGTGTITETNEKTSSVQILFQSDNPKIQKPTGGWIGKSDPLYAYAQQAHQENRTVSYRIEIQRKNDQPLDTPIRELRGTNDMSQANKNTRRILAQIDDKFGTEAVTDPARDEVGGRKSAIGMTPPTDSKDGGSAPSVSLDTVKNLLSTLTEDSALTLAVLSGEDEEVVRSFAQDVTRAPSKLANSVFDVVHEISQRFPQAAGNPADLQNAAESVLYIADSVQVGMFKTNAANRYNASHEQIRSIILSHVGAQDVSQFAQRDMNTITRVAQQVASKYQIVLNILSKPLPERYIPLNGQNNDPQQDNPVQPPQVRESAPEASQETPQQEEQPSYQEEQPSYEKNYVPEESSYDESYEDNDDDSAPDAPEGIFIFSLPKDELEEMRKGATATEETVGLFGQSFGSAFDASEYADLSNFLEYTFGKGIRRANDAPDEALRELIDAYAIAGAEAFKDAVLYVSKELA